MCTIDRGEKFARRAGITRSYMSHIENGRRTVSVDIVERVAKTLGVSLSKLFEGL